MKPALQEIQGIDSQAQMMQAFAEMQNKNDMAEVLKELFVEDKMFMITDLSRDEIRLATKIWMIAEMKNIPIYKKGLEMFSKLMLSHDRKSRHELLDAIKGTMPTTLLQRINPFNKRGGGM